MKKGILLIAFMCLICLILVQGVQAATYYEESINKLGRGLTNMVTSWLEMFETVDYEIEEYGIYKGPIYGTLKGISKFVIRLSAGAYEVLTFPFEYPADYKVLVEPEFIFSKEK